MTRFFHALVPVAALCATAVASDPPTPSTVSSGAELVEVYADEAAFQRHLETPHFLKWQAEVESMFASEPLIVPMETLFPSDSGWISQKPGLLNW